MKTVIEMANLAGLEKISSGWRAWTKDLEQFAAIVRADAIAEERAACAKVCDDQSKEFGGVAEGPFVTDFGKHTQMSMAAGAENCAAAIRERSANARARSNT